MGIGTQYSSSCARACGVFLEVTGLALLIIEAMERRAARWKLELEEADARTEGLFEAARERTGFGRWWSWGTVMPLPAPLPADRHLVRVAGCALRPVEGPGQTQRSLLPSCPRLRRLRSGSIGSLQLN